MAKPHAYCGADTHQLRADHRALDRQAMARIAATDHLVGYRQCRAIDETQPQVVDAGGPEYHPAKEIRRPGAIATAATRRAANMMP